MKAYKKILLLPIVLAISITINAQELIYHDAQVKISPSTTLVLNNGTSLVNNSNKELLLAGHVIFKGSEAQSISGGSVSFSKLSIEDGTSVSLKENVNVNDNLTITEGTILLGDKNLHIKNYEGLKGSFSKNAMIVTDGAGKLKLDIVKDGTYTLPVGDNTDTKEYSPAKFTLSGGKYKDAVVSAQVKNSKYKNNSSTSNYINRYWETSQTGISGFNMDVELTYALADVSGTVSDDFVGAVWNGSKWESLDKVANNKITGKTNKFGVFTAGEGKVLNLDNIDNNEFVKILTNGDGIIVKSTNEFPMRKIEIFNKLGQSIKTFNPSNAQYSECNFNKGNDIYLFRISSDSKVITKKVYIN